MRLSRLVSLGAWNVPVMIILTIQDLDAVEALIQGLVLFQGGVLMVFETSYEFLSGIRT